LDRYAPLARMADPCAPAGSVFKKRLGVTRGLAEKSQETKEKPR
jgi:hypothetical protein